MKLICNLAVIEQKEKQHDLDSLILYYIILHIISSHVLISLLTLALILTLIMVAFMSPISKPWNQSSKERVCPRMNVCIY